jgi:DNA-binding beta-propeller fold protein YncE
MSRCRLLVLIALLAALPAVAQRMNPIYSWLDALNDTISIVPAPGAVVVDGALDDWDLSGEMLSYDFPMFAEERNARTAMMYDGDYLYLSVRYRDTTPLINLHDDRTTAVKDGMGSHTRGWAGDAVQLRLCADTLQGYPLPAQCTVDSLSHLTAWYCTARKEAQLNVSRGMDYHDTKSLFGAASGVAFTPLDGGYALEARFPWALLKCPTAPKAGDRFPMTIQFQFGDTEGLKYAVHDLSIAHEAPYSTAAVWGQGIFEAAGHLTRGPAALPAPREVAKTLVLSATVPAEGSVSLGVFSAKGAPVRALLPGVPRPAGALAEKWDGLDNAGAVLPAGDYGVKILAGPAPAPAAVTRLPRTAGACANDVAVAGSAVYLLWGSPADGANVVKTDLKGIKQWGVHLPAAHAVAADAKNVFLARGAALLTLDAATGKAVGVPLPLPEAPIALEAAGGALYALLPGKVVVVKLGKVVKTLPVDPAARGLGAVPGGLAVATPTGVLRVNLVDGAVAPLVEAKFHDPGDVAVAPDGKALFVADRGIRAVAAFTLPNGLPIGGVGTPGGRLATGVLDMDGLGTPGGIACDATGRLWVAEEDGTPRRLSTWLPLGKSGRLLAEFFTGADYAEPLFPAGQEPEGLAVAPPCLTAHLREIDGKLRLFTANGVWELAGAGVVTTTTFYPVDWAGVRYWSDLNANGIAEPLEVAPEHAALTGLTGSGKDLLLGGKAPLRADGVPYVLEQSAWRDVLGFWRAYAAKLPAIAGRRKPAALAVLPAGKKRLYILDGDMVAACASNGLRAWAVKVDAGPYPPPPGQLRGACALLGTADAGAPVGEVVAVAGRDAVALLTTDGITLAVLPLPAPPVGPLLKGPDGPAFATAGPTETVLWQLTGLAALQRAAATLTLTPDDVLKATRALARALGPK